MSVKNKEISEELQKVRPNRKRALRSEESFYGVATVKPFPPRVRTPDAHQPREHHVRECHVIMPI